MDKKTLNVGDKVQLGSRTYVVRYCWYTPHDPADVRNKVYLDGQGRYPDVNLDRLEKAIYRALDGVKAHGTKSESWRALVSACDALSYAADEESGFCDGDEG